MEPVSSAVTATAWTILGFSTPRLLGLPLGLLEQPVGNVARVLALVVLSRLGLRDPVAGHPFRAELLGVAEQQIHGVAGAHVERGGMPHVEGGHLRRFVGRDPLEQVGELAVDLGVPDGIGAVAALVGVSVAFPGRGRQDAGHDRARKRYSLPFLSIPFQSFPFYFPSLPFPSLQAGTFLECSSNVLVMFVSWQS